MKLGAVVATLLLITALEAVINYNAFEPPHVGGGIPWFGNIVAFGQSPVEFLINNYKKHGPVFSFTMFGERVYYLLGSEASNLFWGSSNDHLNAEDLYANITVPVFGKGVAFDVSNKVFSEQKMISKRGLSKKRFETYTAKIEEECNNYIDERWKGDSGEDDMFEALAEMIVFTATRCLHGIETRKAFEGGDVAALYSDLDGGFSPLAWLFPYWMPFPSFKRRDRAHTELKKRFNEIIENRRRVEQADATDLLATFTTCNYEKVNGKRKFNNDEVSGLLIALLMAGQHTSSTTSSWMGFFLCDEARGNYQDQLYKEQLEALGKNPGPLKLSDLDRMPLLHACVRETLRLRPPIMQLMRNARAPLEIEVRGKKYVIPKGSQVCVSPSVNGNNEEEWEEVASFKPERFLRKVEDKMEVTHGELNENDKHKHKWVPFGAGRHRCIGFEFAQIQIRCIWSTLLRRFEIKLKNGKFPDTNFQTMIHTPLDPYVTWKRR